MRVQGAPRFGTYWPPASLGRTLKSRGYVGIVDNGHGSGYSALLRRLGMTDVRLRALRLTSSPPFHIVTASKPLAKWAPCISRVTIAVPFPRFLRKAEEGLIAKCRTCSGRRHD
jgi:hypothetical protein